MLELIELMRLGERKTLDKFNCFSYVRLNEKYNQLATDIGFKIKLREEGEDVYPTEGSFTQGV